MSESTMRQASILFALAEPTRLQMMQLLNEKPMSTEDFTKHFTIHENTATHHIRVLKDSRLIEGQRHGKSVKYRIVDETLNDAIDILSKIATH